MNQMVKFIPSIRKTLARFHCPPTEGWAMALPGIPAVLPKPPPTALYWPVELG